VESVAWLVERKAVLSSFFLFSAMYSYIIYTGTGKRRLYALSFLLYAIGLMAKPIIMVFPFLLILMDYWPLKRFQPSMVTPAQDINQSGKALNRLLSFARLNRRIVFEKIPFFILSVMSVMISMQSINKYEMAITYVSVPIHLRIFNFIVSIVQYLQKMAWPVDFSIFYPFPQSVPLWQFSTALIWVAAVSIVFFLARKNRPWLLFGWFWFIIALMPASGLIQSGMWPAIANRFMYLPFIGIAIMLIWEMDSRLKGRYSIFLKIVLFAVLVVYFSMLTRVQNVYFTNSHSLFHRSLEVAPENALALNNIAVHLMDLGRNEEAMTYLKSGIERYPAKPSYYNNYGICLVAIGDDENAVDYFRKSLELDPMLYASYLNLALIQSRKGHDDEALSLMEKAMKINSNNLSVRNNYGTFLAKKNRFEDAIPHFSYVIVRDPSNVPARLNLAQAYQDERRFDDAMREYEYLDQTIKANKGFIYYGMAGVYSEQHKYEECLNYLEKAQESAFNVFTLLGEDKRFANFRATPFYQSMLEKLKVSGSG
jgi:Tfp pilus assembly protein PilF